MVWLKMGWLSAERPAPSSSSSTTPQAHTAEADLFFFPLLSGLVLSPIGF
jgi:hypothetical protein